VNDTRPSAVSGNLLLTFRPPVCAYRAELCALDDTPCHQPCVLIGFAQALWWAGYQHWTHEQVLSKLCNPRDYSADADYERLVEFSVQSRRRGAA
jgi:hypothetical protein